MHDLGERDAHTNTVAATCLCFSTGRIFYSIGCSGFVSHFGLQNLMRSQSQSHSIYVSYVPEWPIQLQPHRIFVILASKTSWDGSHIHIRFTFRMFQNALSSCNPKESLYQWKASNVPLCPSPPNESQRSVWWRSIIDRWFLFIRCISWFKTHLGPYPIDVAWVHLIGMLLTKSTPSMVLNCNSDDFLIRCISWFKMHLGSYPINIAWVHFIVMRSPSLENYDGFTNEFNVCIWYTYGVRVRFYLYLHGRFLAFLHGKFHGMMMSQHYLPNHIV